MFVAVIEPGSYLDFAHPVPFSGPAGIVEQGVLNGEGRVSGRAQSAVRPISPSDFSRIVTLGLGESDDLLPRVGNPPQGMSDAQLPFLFETNPQ